MPLTTLPDQGIEVPLSEYNRLRAFQGGGWFWDHDNQQVIREVLGDFLPRVEDRRERGGALFQHFVGATEVASRSEAVGAQMNRVPRSEYQRLQRALDNLKRKAQDPNTDPNARKVIEKFCLPDPAKDPDLYRLHGSGWNRRLLVLWGCEREEGTSLAPVAALNKIAVESPTTTFFRRLPVLLLWLLLLLLLTGAAYWWWRQDAQHQLEQRSVAMVDQSGPSAVIPGRTVAQGPAASAPNAAGSPGATTGGASDRPAIAASHDSSTVLADKARNLSQPSSTAGTSTADADKSAHALAASDATTDSSKITSSKAAAAANLQPATKDAPAMDASRAGAAASPSPTSGGTVNTENRLPANGPKLPSLVAPPTLVISKPESPSTPHNGKMDVTLVAAARASDDSSPTVEITRWTVDDAPQQDQAGHDVTTAKIDLSLPPGKHHVGVMATVRGAKIETDTDLDVEIKSQGDVTLKPRDAKQ